MCIVGCVTTIVEGFPASGDRQGRVGKNQSVRHYFILFCQQRWIVERESKTGEQQQRVNGESSGLATLEGKVG